MSPPAKTACWAVLPAAGIGSRMGGSCAKQYMEIAGATVLEHSLRALLACTRIRQVVVVLHPEDTRAATLDVLRGPRVLTTVGGARRSDSVLAGLDRLAEVAVENDWVLVHDAARPCLGIDALENLITQVLATDIGGVLAQPVVDTLKRASADGRVQATVDRRDLWRAQTPQMFRLGRLRAALAAAARGGAEITDEAAAMEAAGHPVQLVAGDASNLKVTVPDDLALAQWYLERRANHV